MFSAAEGHQKLIKQSLLYAGQDSLADPEQVAQHDYMLVDFALGLLHSSLKKGTLGGQSPAALALLDPMLPLLVRALRSRHAKSVSLALKCLAFLIRLPLPGQLLHLSVIAQPEPMLSLMALWPHVHHHCFLSTCYADHCCLGSLLRRHQTCRRVASVECMKHAVQKVCVRRYV